MKQIAEKTGMALSTVSAVLNGKEYCYTSKDKKELIKRTAVEMGYVPNRMSRGLRGLSTDTVGVVVGSLFTVSVFSIMLASLNEALWKAGYTIMHGDSNLNPEIEKRIIDEFLSRGIDGLIIHSSLEKEKLDKILEGRIPCVYINQLNKGYCVTVDREKGVFMAVEHLIKKHNRRKIGFVTSGLAGNIEKYSGYEKALKKHGITQKDEWTVLSDESGPGVKNTAERIISLGLDSIIASNDIIAGNLMKYLVQAGCKIPEDIAVIGFDGVGFIRSLISPELTTVRNPTELVAEKATEILLALMNGKKIFKKKNIISPELIIASSCGCNKGTEVISKYTR
jgi:DNA-binding LacI/PurR family transcriptional regulator